MTSAPSSVNGGMESGLALKQSTQQTLELKDEPIEVVMAREAGWTSIGSGGGGN